MRTQSRSLERPSLYGQSVSIDDAYVGVQSHGPLAATRGGPSGAAPCGSGIAAGSTHTPAEAAAFQPASSSRSVGRGPCLDLAHPTDQSRRTNRPGASSRARVALLSVAILESVQDGEPSRPGLRPPDARQRLSFSSPLANHTAQGQTALGERGQFISNRRRQQKDKHRCTTTWQPTPAMNNPGYHPRPQSLAIEFAG